MCRYVCDGYPHEPGGCWNLLYNQTSVPYPQFKVSQPSPFPTPAGVQFTSALCALRRVHFLEKQFQTPLPHVAHLCPTSLQTRRWRRSRKSPLVVERSSGQPLYVAACGVVCSASRITAVTLPSQLCGFGGSCNICCYVMCCPCCAGEPSVLVICVRPSALAFASLPCSRQDCTGSWP